MTYVGKVGELVLARTSCNFRAFGTVTPIMSYGKYLLALRTVSMNVAIRKSGVCIHVILIARLHAGLMILVVCCRAGVLKLFSRCTTMRNLTHSGYHR
jgi:hypothetical protein